ncbi:protoporphyrinogen/coproporphyrinogen oxidase [Microcella sp.]|uniref:protoporphyrinogen/coproporphyrinogen oxidase n=1 Tax=Microcella sp. TaxID=1913979 RepID=UPI002567D9C2|nr:FAD-dependent oxidoreductase [Microcella sp.]MBX9472068.1 FAD-dependent oxidoreductase [Microcella sp.]
MSEITVIGAGLAGLVAARELVLQGHTVRVLEASAEAGGQLAHAEIAGHRIDVGALQLDAADDAVSSLLGRVDHAPAVTTSLPRRWWLSTHAGVHPLPAVHWWGVPAAPLAADTVAIIGRRAAWRGMLDALLPGPRGANATTLDELVRIRMGDDIVERLVAPVVEAQTGRDAASILVTEVPGLRHRMLQQNSLTRAVTSLRLDQPENAELATLEGGPSRLIDALRAELERFGVAIEFGTRVDELTDEGAVVNGEVLEGAFVLAAPLGVAAVPERAVVTLVLDSEKVPVGARDAGVLAERGRRDGVRRAVDLSALWPGVTGDDRTSTVVRVEGSNAMTLEGAVRAVGELWGEPELNEVVLGAHLSTWAGGAFPSERAASEHPSTVIALVGEHTVGPGIAHVIRTTIDAVAPLAPEAPTATATDAAAEV